MLPKIVSLHLLLCFLVSLPLYAHEGDGAPLPARPTGLNQSVFKVEAKDFERSGIAFCVDEAGILVTNLNVVGQIRDLDTSLPIIDYSKEIYVVIEGEPRKARVLMTPIDLRPLTYNYVFLRVAGLSLTPLQLGRYEDVQEGEVVYFTGYFDYQPRLSVHQGIVSASYSTPLENEHTGYHEIKLLQIDGPINKRNSGGPVLNAKSEVIGFITSRKGDMATYLKDVTGNIRGEMNISKDKSDSLQSLIDMIDEHMSTGIGFAMGIQHLETHLEQIRKKLNPTLVEEKALKEIRALYDTGGFARTLGVTERKTIKLTRVEKVLNRGPKKNQGESGLVARTAA